MAVSIVKSGYLKRHSKSMFSGGWQDTWVVLYGNSDLCLYKRQGDPEIKAKIHLKDVCKRFAYGQYTNSFPERPGLPKGATYDQVLAIPQRNNSQAKIFWFLCYNTSELNDWMNAFCQVLPPPGQQPTHSTAPPPVVPQTASTVASAPPPYSATPSGPGLGFDNLAGAPPGPGYPTQPGGPAPYPTQAYQSPYPQAPPPQPYMPQQQYPQQGYPQQGYPQQAAYPQQAGYPQQQYGYAPPQGYYQQPVQQGYQQPGQQVVYVQQKPHKSKSGGILGSNTGKMAAGLIGGAALGYGASRMMGHGFGGPFGWGLGRHGSWSSLSSFGSCGSFGSFGSFD